MGTNDKLLRMEIDYESDKDEKNPNLSGVTRNLIMLAFQTNYSSGMDDKMSRIWRNIRKVLDEACDEKTGFVLFSSSDFDTVYKEVYDCKYLPMMSRWAPYLYDELDIIKTRSPEDEQKIQAEMTALYEEAKRLNPGATTSLKSVPNAS